MGQYFTPVILDARHNIVRAVDPHDYGSGDKLAGHARAETPFMAAVETLLALDGGARLVWAGDNDDGGLYFRVEPHHIVRFAGRIDPVEPITPNAIPPVIVTPASHRYICNADKHEYGKPCPVITTATAAPHCPRSPPKRATPAAPAPGPATASTSPPATQATAGPKSPASSGPNHHDAGRLPRAAVRHRPASVSSGVGGAR